MKCLVRSVVHGHRLQALEKLKAFLDYMRPCLQKETEEQKMPQPNCPNKGVTEEEEDVPKVR